MIGNSQKGSFFKIFPRLKIPRVRLYTLINSLKIFVIFESDSSDDFEFPLEKCSDDDEKSSTPSPSLLSGRFRENPSLRTSGSIPAKEDDFSSPSSFTTKNILDYDNSASTDENSEVPDSCQKLSSPLKEKNKNSKKTKIIVDSSSEDSWNEEPFKLIFHKLVLGLA